MLMSIRFANPYIQTLTNLHRNWSAERKEIFGRILSNLQNILNSENGRPPKTESQSSKEYEF